jgi:hypothetical protein
VRSIPRTPNYGLSQNPRRRYTNDYCNENDGQPEFPRCPEPCLERLSKTVGEVHSCNSAKQSEHEA